MMPIRLNLGCSGCIRAGWQNVDCRPLAGVDMVWDLERTPWPWCNESVDEIFASHVLEHLADPLGAILEMRRILKPGGKLCIIVPNASGYMGYAIGHKSYMSRQWFSDLLGNADHQNDCGRLFVNECIRFGLLHNRVPRGRIMGALIRGLEWIGNCTPNLQTAWELSGVLVPGELRFTATKR